MRAARSPPTVSGSPHQIPRPTNRATKTGASAVPRPSRALSASTATSTRRGKSEAASELTTGIVSPKPIPMSARGAEQKGKRRSMRPQRESARDEQRHRRQIGAEAQQEDALFPPPASESAAEQRGGHRQDGLGREHDPVLAVREAVRVRVGEHGAGRGERDQRQPLQEARRVDRADLLPAADARRAARRWLPRLSPARHPQALAQVVPDAERVRHRGQPGVHRADAGEEAGVDDVEVVELVRLAVHVEHRRLGIGAEATGAGLVRRPRRPPSRSSGRGCGATDGPGASRGGRAST